MESLQRQWYIGVKHIKIALPKYVGFIIDKLYEKGYEAFAVGGCVRDVVMGRTPHDWDITTNALPEIVKETFNKTIDTGIKHGTVTVMIKRVGYEVTTYRIDGEYTDGRHPKEVIYTSDLAEDLKRRDFTINAMAYNYRTGIIDKFNGVKDIENKIIRCVGNPTDRFKEDALRMLRAIRFSAQLDFSIDKETYEAIKLLADNLSLISKERIQAELTKTITSENPDRIILICKLKLYPYIFAEGSLLSQGNTEVYEKVSDIMKYLPKNSYLRYAGLLTYEKDVEKILRFLKLDNKTIKIVSKLVYNKDLKLLTDKVSLRRVIVVVGKDVFYDYYLAYIEALIKAGYEGIDITIAEYKAIYEICEEIYNNNDCLSLSEMAITGRDLKEFGLPDGKQIGDILKTLFDKVIENPELNHREILMSMAEKLI